MISSVDSDTSCEHRRCPGRREAKHNEPKPGHPGQDSNLTSDLG